MYGALCTQLNEFSFFKQKTAYEMRISDWSSDVCSSDLQSKGLALRPQVTTASVIACCCAGSFAATKPRDRKSVVEGQSVSVRVDLGGRRIIKKKKPDQANVIVQHLTHIHI